MLLASALGVLSGCDKEQTQTKQTPILSRTEPAPQSAQQAAQQQNAAAGQSAAPSSNAQTGAKPPQYLPPSAEGAEVQITEKPLGGEPAPTPPATAPSPPTAAAGDHGGNMPTQVPPAPPAGPAPAGAPAQATTGSANPQTPPSPGVLATPSATARARTGDEHTGALQQELQRKLAEFDALMRKAQENAAKDRAAGAGSPESGTRGQGGLLEAPPTTGAGGAANAASGLGNTPDKSGSTSSGETYRSGAARATPDGSDDDIVARQLREAANRETDPVLREKLWEEYRKYKGGL